jgi:tRNA-dihydrouridine synthase B
MWIDPPNEFHIGPVRVSPPLVMAPMAGFTTSAFRRICRRHGAGMVVTEMISCYGLHYRDAKTREMLAFHPEERPIAVQIFGAEPDVCAHAAGMVAATGVEMIDINMGCAVPKVAKTGAGAALMKDPDRAVAVARSVVEAVTIPVTAKLRIGWRGEGQDATVLGKRLQDVGVQGLCLHARYARQDYNAPADWIWIARLKEAVSIPVIGNGDVRSLDDARMMIDETGCDGVMIGRAALTNPAIFAGGGHTANERLDLAEEHIHLASEAGDVGRGGQSLRAYMLHYLRGFDGARRLRGRISQMESLDDAMAILGEVRAGL